MILNIESHEGNIYLANIQKNSAEKHYITDDAGKPMVFPAISHIKEYFENQSFEHIWLIQTTPYDEMIGLSPATQPIRMQLHWHTK